MQATPEPEGRGRYFGDLHDEVDAMRREYERAVARPRIEAAPIVVRAEAASSIADYARIPIPIAFEVRHRLELVDASPLDGLPLVGAPVDLPYRKDYDADRRRD